MTDLEIYKKASMSRYKNYLAYAENQWDPNAYIRLPEKKVAELA